MKTLNTLIISKLNNVLKQKNITQKDLGNGIGVSKTTINNWINDRSKIDAVSLKRISEFLKVPITYFFTDDNNTSTMNAVGEPETKYNTDCNCDELKSTLATKNQIIEELQFNYNALKLTVELLERQIEILRGEK